jgi:ABC-2 type transport system ATP-binding protein
LEPTGLDATASIDVTNDLTKIRLSGVRKRYGRRLALDGVTLEIGAGVTGLLGPNGSGKSTLIKSLMGLVSTEAGDGHVMNHAWPAEARSIRDLVGYLPEDDCYIAGLQGVESVQLSGRLSGLPTLESLRRAHEVMDFCDIGQERYRTVETYSTGMRQKLKFAQTLVHDPPLIILDEPTTGLDPTQREALLNRISVLARKFGKTILLSTHILPDVQQVCDAVVILVKGKIRVTGSLEHLSQPASPGLRVAFSSGREKFIEHVRHLGLQVDASDVHYVHIDNMRQEQALEVWNWASQCGAAVSSLEPARASLEKIFMEAVRE